jgi:hypothetical protein
MPVLELLCDDYLFPSALEVVREDLFASISVLW